MLPIMEKAIRLKSLHPDDTRLDSLHVDGVVPGMFSDDDIRIYKELYNKVPINGFTLEIGCFLGRSITSVADIIKEKNLKVFLVDKFNLHHWGYWKDATIYSHYDEVYEVLRHFNIHKNVCAFSHSSHVADVFFKNNKFDLIFIDTDHTYECLSKEIELYRPKLRNGGIFCGHDFNPNFPGVIKAVKEAYGENYINDGNFWITPR